MKGACSTVWQTLEGVNLNAAKQDALPLAPGEYTAGYEPPSPTANHLKSAFTLQRKSTFAKVDCVRHYQVREALTRILAQRG